MSCVRVRILLLAPKTLWHVMKSRAVTHEFPSGYTWNSERLHTNFRVVTHEIPNGYTRISEWLHMKFRFRQLHTNFWVVTHENPRGYTWISKKLHMKNQNIQFFGHILNTPYFWTPYANCKKVRPSAGLWLHKCNYYLFKLRNEEFRCLWSEYMTIMIS